MNCLNLSSVMHLAVSLWSLASCTPMESTQPNGPVLVEFGRAMAEPWRVLNDNVMGGVSEGELAWTDSTVMWKGATRLENNGGFASVRSTWGARNLSDLDQIVVKCRGTGGPFKLTMETSERWWMPYAYASFEPTAEWQEVVISASDLKWSQAQMGDLTSVRPWRDLGQVLRLGLMKYDGTAQAFDLEVASIAFLPRQGAGSKP